MPSTRRRLNLEDIAQKAGVSRSTVSRVINNDPNVHQQTRSHVLAIIERENYSPNLAARSMVTNRTQVIGVIIPHELHTVFIDPHYFPSLLQGVSIAVHRRDYAMLLYLRQTGEDQEIFFRKILGNGLMDGLIIASASLTGTLLSDLISRRVKFVMVEKPDQFEDQISYVTIDNIAASREVVQHLFDTGRRRIGIITGSLDNMDGRERLIGFREGLEQVGLQFDERLVVEGDFSRKTAYALAERLIIQNVDAIYACNDIMAQGAYEAIYERGLRIPEDIAVVGFDNLATATEIKPGLTTVHQPIEQKGEVATELLLDLIEAETAQPKEVVLPTQLIIRNSTLPRSMSMDL